MGIGRGEQITVLHVDDEPDFADMASEFLEREDEDIAVQAVTNPEEGLEFLEKFDIDCIVADYYMPQMDGIEFLRTIRKQHENLPFILYTGKGSEELASRAISAGVTDYFPKGTDSDQFALLANRIRNAVEQYRANRRAVEEHRINTVIREIDEALVGATTQEGIEEEVCRIISNADPYRFAWIGGHDPQEKRVIPRAYAGIGEEYLESISISTDDSDTGQGPTGQAVQKGELVVMQDIPNDPEYEPWRDSALEYGFKSSAALPLSYDGTLYGVLNVYADRTHAFDETERQLLRDLSDSIAHAYHRIDLQRQYTEQYRTLFDEAPIMVVFTRVTDEGPTIDDCNQTFADKLGYSREELLNTKLANFYSDASEEKLIEEGYERALQGEFTREQRTLVTKDGEEILTILRAGPRRNTKGEIIGTHALYLDITEERQVQELERMNALFEQAQEIANLGAWETDLRNNDGWWTEQVNRIYGLPEGHEPGPAEGFEFFHPDDRETIREAFERAKETGEPYDLELRVESNDGEFKWVRAKGSPQFEDGEVVAVRGTLQDITQRKQQEQQLERIKERFQAFVEYSSDVLTILDEDGKITYESPAVERVLGYEAGSREGENAFDYIHPEDRQRVFDRFMDIVAGNTEVTERIEYRTKHADGSWVWIESIGNSRTETALGGYVVNSREITERIEREQELERQNERLDEFTSLVSHDLRNPLNVANGRISLAKEECEDENLDIAEGALERMEILIDDLLTLARTGQKVSDLESVDLASVIEGCWPNVETADVTLEVNTNQTIKADESRLNQLFENLIRNAVEHGGSNVTLIIGDIEDGFYIEDSGSGIPEEEREKVFQPGYSTVEEGTGLGLNIVREIVQAHGWHIQAMEGTEGGARFEITGVDRIT